MLAQFMLNEYSISLIFGFGLASISLIIVFIEALYQIIWAWIDDAKRKQNRILKFCSIEKYKNWKYPIYNGARDKKENKIFGYAEEKKYHNSTDIYHLYEGVDYIYVDKKTSSSWFALVPTVLFLLPITTLWAFKIYPVVLSIGSFTCIMYLTRYFRRLNKKYNNHVNDVNAHKGEELKNENNK